MHMEGRQELDMFISSSSCDHKWGRLRFGRSEIVESGSEEKLSFWAFYIGNAIVRSEIGGSGSEKKLCTLLRSKP